MKKSLLTLGLFGLSLGAFAQNPFPLVGPFVEVNTNVNNIQTPPNLGIAQINTISPTFCWALAYDAGSTPVGPKNTVLTPSNATGTEFNYLSVAGTPMFQPANISAVSTTLAYCAQYSGSMNGGGGEVIRTINGGNTWRKITTNTNFALPAGFANWVSMFDANVGVAMGDPNPLPGGGGPGVFEIIRTTNASATAANPVLGATAPTWTRVTAVPTALTAGEYGIVESYTSLGNSIWCGTSHTVNMVDQPCRVLRSVDRGLTWTAANTPLAGAISKLAFKDQNNGIAYRQNTASADLIRTTDGGLTWAVVPLPTGRDTLCGKFYRYDIQAIPGQGFISMGQAVAGERRPFNFGVSFSPDGIQWYDIEKGVRSYIAGGLINCVATPTGRTYQGYLGGFTGRAGSVGFPAGGQGGMYQVSPTVCATLPTGATCILATRSAELQRTLSVYPNPSSNGVFQVSLNDGIKAGTTLTVFDVMGRVVLTRELNATAIGSKTFNLNLSNEKSGVYTLRVAGASGFATSKLVVE